MVFAVVAIKGCIKDAKQWEEHPLLKFTLSSDDGCDKKDEDNENDDDDDDDFESPVKKQTNKKAATKGGGGSVEERCLAFGHELLKLVSGHDFSGWFLDPLDPEAMGLVR